MGSYVKGIIIIIILFFLITFGVENSQPVRLKYYFNVQTGDFPLYGLVYLTIFIGILIGMVIGISRRLTLKRRIRNLDREYGELKVKVMEREESKSVLTTPPAAKTEV
jgi:uncharacterized integral membrane protein